MEKVMVKRDPQAAYNKTAIKLLIKILPPDSKLNKQLKKILLMKN